jgi:hypothetical protein
MIQLLCYWSSPDWTSARQQKNATSNLAWLKLAAGAYCQARPWFVAFLCLIATVTAGDFVDQPSALLPKGVKAVWDMDKAHRESTPTRERICLNGLWQWQPANAQAEQVPARDWGYFKVPGCWPGITDYMQKECQTLYAHPSWQSQKLGSITAAWYQRQITVPSHWAGRRIAVCVEYLNSYAVVYVDGKKAGEIRFPGGEVELTSACPPGSTCLLSLLVVAMPLKGVMLSFTETASARQVKGSVPRRGLCGDVYLVSTPRGPRTTDVKVDTSVRRQEFTFDAALVGLEANARYTLGARILKDGRSLKEFTSRAFQQSDLKDGRLSSAEKWIPDHLWDIHTPQNLFDLEVWLLDAAGKVLDAGWTERFGFREFWTQGRDFFLNGTRIFLSAVPFDNAQVGAALANYAAARESLARLKSFGINFVYTHNYGCEPGSHLGFAEILRAADDAGMLVGFSQPHFSHYDWQAPEADRSNGYARHAEFYVRAAQNHPAVVMYSMSHNATGYNEDMNPDMIDGIHDARDTWALRNAKLALRAEAIVKRLDPSRIVYHHASGNLGAMHTSNFYPNFAPIQELSDWFEHWATQGVKPVFTCEYGAPFSWDWTMYRGWYKGQREFGSAQVPWEFCLAEWNAQFIGDRAFQLSEPEKANLRWEATQFRTGRLWHRWDYPYEVGSTRFDERYPVFVLYLTDNWRAFRAWGLSAISPWEHGHFWKLRDGVDKRRKQFAVDWENLQRPGFSPDYLEQRYERMDLAFEQSDWIATPAAQALIRNNGPLLAYIGGKPARFTSKDHNFFPGESVEKQIIIINNCRQTVRCDSQWWFRLPHPASGSNKVVVATGQQERIPLRFQLPVTLPPGRYELNATVKFSNGETQQDSVFIDVLPLRAPPVDRHSGAGDPPVNVSSGAGDPPVNVSSGAGDPPVNVSSGAGDPPVIVAQESRSRNGRYAAKETKNLRDVAALRRVPPISAANASSPLRLASYSQIPQVWRPGPQLFAAGTRRTSESVTPPITTGTVKIALFDPKGETGALLSRLGIRSQPVEAGANLSACDILIVGKSVLTTGVAAPDIMRVRDGLKVIVFEQTAEALEKRFGFRVAEYGLRKVFPRVPDHPSLAGISAEHLRDWRGEATILAPRLKYEMRPRYGPTVQWCGLPVTRLWRCGNRGNVASVLIEKPARGDFLPILDGGYSLQYSPLLEYREGRGMVLFCQMDVTGRTETEPAAETLAWNLLQFVSAWNPAQLRRAAYAGDPAGKSHLEAAGVSVDSYDGRNLSPEQVLVLGPKSSRQLADHATAIADWLKAGGNLLAIGLDQEDTAALLPFIVTMKKAEHISTWFEPFGMNSPLVGIGPADVHNRDPRQLPLVSAGAKIIGNGVLAKAEEANVIFCQIAPWQFADNTQPNLKRTHRRVSFLVSRLLANLGTASSRPLLDRFSRPLNAEKPEKRWQNGLYLDQPEEWDDPYRFFRW